MKIGARCKLTSKNSCSRLSRFLSRSIRLDSSQFFSDSVAHADAKRRQHEGTLGLITSLAVSIGFIFLGKIIFRALGITVSDFQVAGGLILLGIAVRELLDLGGARPVRGRSFWSGASRDAAHCRAGVAYRAPHPGGYGRDHVHRPGFAREFAAGGIRIPLRQTTLPDGWGNKV